ncbi:MAG: aminoglycoside phosphotransferase family protein [Thermoleophilia bacterium]
MAVEVPAALAASHALHHGAAGRAWTARLPGLAAETLERWALRPDGPPRHGAVALVLPVVRGDGSPAALKLQIDDPEHPGEAAALRAWDGDGAVRLLDEATGDGGSILLLERLDARRDLLACGERRGLEVLAGLLRRLNARPAPAGVPRLSAVAGAMVAATSAAAKRLADPAERRTLRAWAARVAEVAADAGDRLLHWDLHHENVLASAREPWLAIDPKPLAGDPGFELHPALRGRWADVAGAADPGAVIRRRFDLLSEGLDRPRAVAWTLARCLQDGLWEVEDGATRIDAVHLAIAEALDLKRASCPMLPSGVDERKGEACARSW